MAAGGFGKAPKLKPLVVGVELETDSLEAAPNLNAGLGVCCSPLALLLLAAAVVVVVVVVEPVTDKAGLATVLGTPNVNPVVLTVVVVVVVAAAAAAPGCTPKTNPVFEATSELLEAAAGAAVPKTKLEAADLEASVPPLAGGTPKLNF